MLEKLVFDECAISNEKSRGTAASYPLMLTEGNAECEVRCDGQTGTIMLLSAYSLYQHYYCQHRACTNIATVSIQHVTTLLLSAYSMYQHCYCQHTACTNITTVSIQHVPKFLLSAYSMYQHYYCQHTAYTKIPAAVLENIPALFMSAHVTIIQYVALFHIFVTKVQ
jgi:hypothetical protein